MNSASNKVNVKLWDGRRLQIQVVHLSDAPVSKNPKGLAEDYCLIFEERAPRPLLFRIAARNPLRIEPLDLESPEGNDHWMELDAYLKTKT